MKTFIPVCYDEVSSLCDITLIKLLTLISPSAKENRADIPKLSQGDTSATPTDTSNQAADGAQNKLNVFGMQLCHKDTLGAEDRKSLVTMSKLLLSTRVNREPFNWFFGSVSVQVEYIILFSV